MPLNIDNITTEKLSVNGNPIGNYKVYTDLLTQSGTDDPVATVLENTLGIELVWTRQGEGSYIGTSFGLFSNPLKVGIILSSIQNPITTAGENDENTIYIETNTDGDLYNAFLEIRVYN